jgi:membrane protein DedA with SNARE-associated domain
MRTLTNIKKIASLIAVFAMSVCMSVVAFADDKKSWFDSQAGQIVGYCIAGVLFVAMVVFIIWWIPKEKDKKGKKVKTK